MRAFCEPETTTSRPQASVSHGTAPRLETASTTTSAPASFATAANACTSATTPVDVSDCTIQTALASRSLRRARRSSASGVSPQAYRSTSTSAPNAVVIATQRSPKLPAETTRCGSPGETRLATADSNAPVPDEPKRSTSLSVRHTSRRRREHALVDRQELGAAVVDDRRADGSQHLGRHRRRSGREQVALRGHVSERSDLRCRTWKRLVAFAAALLAFRLAGLLGRAVSQQPAAGAPRVGRRARRLRGRRGGDRVGRGRRLGRARIPRLLRSGRSAHRAAAGRGLPPPRRPPPSRAGRARLRRPRCRHLARGAGARRLRRGHGIPAAQDHLAFLPARLLAILANVARDARRGRGRAPLLPQAPARERLIIAGIAAAATGSGLAGLGAAGSAIGIAVGAVLLYAGFVAPAHIPASFRPKMAAR